MVFGLLPLHEHQSRLENCTDLAMRPALSRLHSNGQAFQNASDKLQIVAFLSQGVDEHREASISKGYLSLPGTANFSMPHWILECWTSACIDHRAQECDLMMCSYDMRSEGTSMRPSRRSLSSATASCLSSGDAPSEICWRYCCTLSASDLPARRQIVLYQRLMVDAFFIAVQREA